MYKKYAHILTDWSSDRLNVVVPDSKSRNIPKVVIARRGAVGVLGIWKGWDSWVKGGQMGSVYKQPEREVDDSCHSWRVPSK